MYQRIYEISASISLLATVGKHFGAGQILLRFQPIIDFYSPVFINLDAATANPFKFAASNRRTGLILFIWFWLWTFPKVWSGSSVDFSTAANTCHLRIGATKLGVNSQQSSNLETKKQSIIYEVGTENAFWLASWSGRLGGCLEGDWGKLSRTAEVRGDEKSGDKDYVVNIITTDQYGFQVPWVILRQNAGADAICYGRDGKESLLRIDPAEFSCLSYF